MVIVLSIILGVLIFIIAIMSFSIHHMNKKVQDLEMRNYNQYLAIIAIGKAIIAIRKEQARLYGK